MSVYTDGVVPWNSLDDNTRLPQASELEGGYPCGEADRELFNWTVGYPIGQIYNVLLGAGIVPDLSDLTQLKQALSILYPRILTQDLHIYVRPDGDDNNDGLTNSASGAFKTIQAAVDRISARYSGTGFTVVVHIAAGTYNGFAINGGNVRNWRFLGAGVLSTFVNATSTSVNSGRGILTSNAEVVVQDISFSAYFECAGVSPQGGSIEVITCNFNMASASSYGVNAAGGLINLFGNIKFSGSGLSNIAAIRGSIRLGFYDGVTSRPVALEWAPGTTVTDANVLASDGGSVLAFPTVVFQDGTPSGRRYSIRLNGIINTQGSGVNFFAGTTVGATATGGQYV
ncbi:hypothetical protein ACIQT7_18150 [Agrobacterium deltaense]